QPWLKLSRPQLRPGCFPGANQGDHGPPLQRAHDGRRGCPVPPGAARPARPGPEPGRLRCPRGRPHAVGPPPLQARGGQRPHPRLRRCPGRSEHRPGAPGRRRALQGDAGDAGRHPGVRVPRGRVHPRPGRGGGPRAALLLPRGLVLELRGQGAVGRDRPVGPGLLGRGPDGGGLLPHVRDVRDLGRDYQDPLRGRSVRCRGRGRSTAGSAARGTGADLLRCLRRSPYLASARWSLVVFRIFLHSACAQGRACSNLRG
ncbi:unnamed protein product, partial [Prorocentrum cordatum]